MALRALMKRRELDNLNKELSQLRGKADELNKRELELEKAINEVETDEERSAVEGEVDAFENERSANDDAIAEFEQRIADIEKELETLEANQATPAATPQENERKDNKKIETRGIDTMNKRNIFRGLDMETRSAMFERDDVKEFIAAVRTCMTEKRAIQGAGLLVPKPFLGLLRENIESFSKLVKHVNYMRVNGEGRMAIMAPFVEAVWTECCGKLNELDFAFNQAEVGCWKVAGYTAVCNASLEDSDIDLMSELIIGLGYAIGYAVDKAIVFGLGTRMPLGFFTRLAQTSKPADYPDEARAWVDLHTTNIKKTNKTGVNLFADIIAFAGAAKGKYSRGTKVWVMNETTYAYLQAQGLSVNAAGAIVTGVNGAMPIVGGVVEVLDFVPDYMIFGGYLDLYLLAERAGTRITQSEHVRFTDDQTVVRGVARYDGTPLIAEGFIAIGVNNVDPSAASISFAPDTANEDVSE